MPSVYQLKPRFQALLRPLLAVLARAGIRPNHITVAAIALSIGAGAALAIRPTAATLLALPAVCLLRMALNALDGMLAREHDLRSNLGLVLNELGDVVSDVVLFLPLAAVPGVPPLLCVAAVFAGLVTEMAGSVAVHIGATRRFDGPMGKSDRAVVFGTVGLLLGLGVAPGAWVAATLVGVVLLAVVTTVVRCSRALSAAGEMQVQS
jgi:CDP-diacylglycerol--glycerol-3-phosphate 3-phosphatidyltransferase